MGLRPPNCPLTRAERRVAVSNPGQKFASAMHSLVTVAMNANIAATEEVAMFMVAWASSAMTDDEDAGLVTEHREFVDAIVRELRATVPGAAADAAAQRAMADKKPAFLN